ncbi:hypothetical protein Tco_1124759 [Tanacetum coccineum]|uniref:Uncharacterized protein n=1 Tax=Tanacetum coccineum TaxID=301880 RepID=A0ABQ5J7G1_9ASTR
MFSSNITPSRLLMFSSNITPSCTLTIARPLHGVKLLGGPASVDFDFCNDLVMKRVAKTIALMDAVAKTMILNSAGLQTKLLRHTGIVASGPIFDDALRVFNTSMETDLLSNSSIPLFSVSKPCSACSKVFARDIYGDHAVSCAGIIGIKHRHNVVHDTLVDICYRSGISAGLDVCLDLTGSSPLTQTGMADFVPGRALVDAAQRKHAKGGAVTLLKRIRKFSMSRDIEARAAVHIFNRISFAIAIRVGAQIVSRLPSNLL